MFATIQRLIGEETSLGVRAAQLTPSADLYACGMTSFDAARLMIAIEREFKVAFPLSAMRRDTMSSIVSISVAVLSLWQAEMDRPARREAA